MLAEGTLSFAIRPVGRPVSAVVWSSATVGDGKITRYVRYAHAGQTSYGVLEGDTVRELAGDPFGSPRPTGRIVAASEVRLLAPTEPSKVIAVGLNYRSHIGERPVPTEPGVFAKLPSAVIGTGDDIVIPPDSTSLHYEGELVIVIGKRVRNATEADVPRHIFGVTAGNDVSERTWQRNDLQWLRAKATDTFGPVGPAVVQGLDFGNLLVQTRVNGEVRQSERSNDLVFDVPAIISYLSRYVTLEPGDLIFTGTPGSTAELHPGDVVEVEVEGVGVLRNRVVGPASLP